MNEFSKLLTILFFFLRVKKLNRLIILGYDLNKIGLKLLFVAVVFDFIDKRFFPKNKKTTQNNRKQNWGNHNKLRRKIKTIDTVTHTH